MGFYRNRSTADGHAGYCKPCHGIRAARYESQRYKPRDTAMAAHRKVVAELRARGLRRCPDCGDVKSIAEGFYVVPSTNTGLSTYCKACDVKRSNTRRAADPGKRNSYEKARREADPERYRESSRVAASRRRALKRDAFVEDVVPLVVLERDDSVCGICGEDIWGDFDVDHIEPLAHGGEHSYANVRAAHVTCNRSRGRAIALAAA